MKERNETLLVGLIVGQKLTNVAAAHWAMWCSLYYHPMAIQYVSQLWPDNRSLQK